jgi:hypothetical protein
MKSTTSCTRSTRGYQLVDTPNHSSKLLTVELYHKWYELVLLNPDGSTEVIPFPDDKYAPRGESAYRDHVPNPRAVQQYAEEHDLEIGEFALELMIGRWHIDDYT